MWNVLMLQYGIVKWDSRRKKKFAILHDLNFKKNSKWMPTLMKKMSSMS